MKSIKFQSSSKEGKRKELEELSPAAKRGMEMFRKGYNCCQSTFGAFYEDLGLDMNTAMRMASSSPPLRRFTSFWAGCSVLCGQMWCSSRL